MGFADVLPNPSTLFDDSICEYFPVQKPHIPLVLVLHHLKANGKLASNQVSNF